MKQLLAEIWKTYFTPGISAFAAKLSQAETLWRIAPWVLGFVLIGWGMKHFGLNLGDLIRPVKVEAQQFSHDASALVNGEAMARIQSEMRGAKVVIEMPQTMAQDKESKEMARELYAARQEMLEQRRQALEKHTQGHK